jgi:hypothetical protein
MDFTFSLVILRTLISDAETRLYPRKSEPNTAMMRHNLIQMDELRVFMFIYTFLLFLCLFWVSCCFGKVVDLHVCCSLADEIPGASIAV